MARILRPFLVPAIASFLSLTLATGHASADELIGKVKSVDATAKKVIVTDKATDKDTEISIVSETTWMKEKKGKVSKKFDLANLKVGSTVEVTRDGAVASKIVIKQGKKKKATVI